MYVYLDLFGIRHFKCWNSVFIPLIVYFRIYVCVRVGIAGQNQRCQENRITLIDSAPQEDDAELSTFSPVFKVPISEAYTIEVLSP
jgi:hypothetical protein